MLTTFAAAAVLALAPLAGAQADVPAAPLSPVDGLPSCQYEDGNPGGLPCVWTDPDTGRLYFNDGANYR